jgi:hypothetical protein
MPEASSSASRGKMSSFSKEDHVFYFQTLGSESKEQYPGMSYMDFWGDQYEWTSLLPIAWKMCSTNGRLKPPVNNPELAHAWWSVPFHLLGLGMGWTNLALGLQQWRESGYRTDHQLLKFLFESYGTSLEALEVWLVKNQDTVDEFTESLKFHGFTQVEPDENLRAEQYDQAKINTLGDYLETAKRHHSFGPRWKMAEYLFGGGWDPLHLSVHFLGSAEFSETVVHEVRELDEIEVLFNTEDRIGIKAPAYKGFPYRLIEGFGNHMEKHEQSPIISLYIESLGHIGDFRHSMTTGRFYLASNGLDVEAQHEFHLMGTHV